MQVVRDYNQYTVADGNDPFWRIFANKTWEPTTFKIFDQFLDSRKTFVDIGSWIGPTVLYAASRAKDVFAFEPDPVAYHKLVKNIALNNIENVVPYPVAVSDRWKGMKFGAKTQYGDSMSSELWAKNRSETVPAISLESVILDLQPNFVKIDIEGGERTIFDGCQFSLENVKPTIHLSLHTPWFKENVDDLKVSIWESLHVYPYFYDQNLKRIEFDDAFDVNAFNSIVATFKEI